MAARRLLSRDQVLERTLAKFDRKALRELIDDGRVSPATKAKRNAARTKLQG